MNRDYFSVFTRSIIWWTYIALVIIWDEGESLFHHPNPNSVWKLSIDKHGCKHFITVLSVEFWSHKFGIHLAIQFMFNSESCLVNWKMPGNVCREQSHIPQYRIVGSVTKSCVCICTNMGLSHLYYQHLICYFLTVTNY